MDNKKQNLESVKESIDDDIKQLRALRNLIISNKNILNKDIKDGMIVTLNQVLSSLAQANGHIIKIDPEKLLKTNSRDIDNKCYNFKQDKQKLEKMVFGSIIYEKLKYDENIFETFEILDGKKIEGFYLNKLNNGLFQFTINYINLKGIFTSQIIHINGEKFQDNPKILLFTN